MDAPRPHPVVEAQARILARVRRGAAESVGLDAAFGRVLAAAVAAPADLPPLDASAMDGYAGRAADTAGGTTNTPPTFLYVGGQAGGAGAGGPADAGGATITSPSILNVVGGQGGGAAGMLAGAGGGAAAIAPGAPPPAGADAVVRVEETDGGTARVAVRAAVAAGAHVRRRGEVVRADAALLPAGTTLGPGQIGLLAAIGIDRPPVVARPRVAILSTGNDLVPPGQPVRAAQIPDANGPMIAALVAQYGGIPLPLGIARDTDAEIARALDGLPDADLIITTGGVSMGTYDAVRAAIQARGTLDFWQVRMRPGRPVAFGVVGRTPVLALPGNPVAAFVAFHLLARPALARMLGAVPEIPAAVPARLAAPVA